MSVIAVVTSLKSATNEIAEILKDPKFKEALNRLNAKFPQAKPEASVVKGLSEQEKQKMLAIAITSKSMSISRL